jgi:hypothetical protein
MRGCRRRGPRKPGGEAADEPVPHHPPAGGEPEHPVAGLHVTVQLVLAQVLEERAAGSVDDALGSSGRPRRVHDQQRMVEGQMGELRVGGPARRVPSQGTCPPVGDRTRYGRRPPCVRSGDRVHCCTTVAFTSCTWPLYRYPSTVMSTLGSICPNRSITPMGPKSGEVDDQIAPIAAVASIVINASGPLATRAATRSPGTTPISTRPA